MGKLDDLPKVPTGMRLARPPVPSYPQSEGVGLAYMTSEGLVWGSDKVRIQARRPLSWNSQVGTCAQTPLPQKGVGGYDHPT